MARRFVAAALVLALVPTPLMAQSLRESISPVVAKLEQAQAQQTGPMGMSPGYFWTGISLIGAGALYTLVGLAADDDIDDFCDDQNIDCGGVSKGLTIFGVALAGTGVALLMIGKRKAGASPELVATPGGFAIRQRISFGKPSKPSVHK